jgi:hypothetical protein
MAQWLYVYIFRAKLDCKQRRQLLSRGVKAKSPFILTFELGGLDLRGSRNVNIFSYFSLVRAYLLAGRDAVVLDSTLVVLIEPGTCTTNILVSNRRVLALMTS